MNEEKRNRRNLAIVLVRACGVYFTYVAVTKAVAIPYAIFWIASLRGVEIDRNFSFATGFSGMISFLVTAGIAFYLLKKGNWLIDFISKDPSEKQQEVDPDAVGNG